MTTYLFTFLIPLCAALVLTPLVRMLAIRMGAVDQPDARRIHVVPTPRMGGIAVALAFTVPLALLYFHPNKLHDSFFRDPSLLWGLGLGGVMILVLGIYDDIKNARPLLKLLVQGLIAVLCYKLGFQMDFVGTPFDGDVIPLDLLSLPITVLWVVGVINAVNLIDGVDGLASGVAFFACVTLFVISTAGGTINHMSALITAALAGALLGFLVFNFNPATIFLGDTGSMFLGFILAMTSIQCTSKRYTAVSILIPAMALGLPLLDTGLAMVRRAVTGRPIMSADRHHIHHRLLYRGLSQRQTVLTLYGLCAMLSAVSISTAYLQSRGILTVLFIALVVVMVLLVRYMRIGELIRDEWKQLFQGGLFTAVQGITSQLMTVRQQLEGAGTLPEVWHAIQPLVRGLSLARLSLEVRQEPHGEPWKEELLSATPLEPGQPVTVLPIELMDGEQHRVATLQLAWVQDNAGLRIELMRLYVECLREGLTRACQRALAGEVTLATRRSLVTSAEPISSTLEPGAAQKPL